jgi:hypothetical protein
VVVAAAAVNGLAYRHAHALGHFSQGGARTPRAEALTALQKARVLLVGPNLPKPRNRRTPRDLGLAFERHAFPGAFGDEIEAWLVPGPPGAGLVVLFHGHASAKDSLLPAARELHRMGYATLLVDFHGSGGSSGNRTSIGFHEAQDVSAAYRYAAGLPGPPRIALYGQSMGAAAVLRAAAREGLEPHAIILETPFDRLRTTVAHRFRSLRVPAVLVPVMLFWGGVQQGFDPFAHNPVEYARSVAVPALLMAGDRDPWVSVEESRSILEALRGPRELVLFAGLPHVSLLAARPAQWRTAMAGFLRRSLGGHGESRPAA